MKFEVKNGDTLSQKEVEDMIALHHLVFSQQRSPIRLFRSSEELKELLMHANCLSIIMYDEEEMLQGFLNISSTQLAFADHLLPWVNFDFYRQELEGVAWYISAIVIRPSQQNSYHGKNLMIFLQDWLYENNIKMISFDCNTFYSGFVPLIVSNIAHDPEMLFPNSKIAEQLLVAGRHGLHANPVWFYCLDKSYYPKLVTLFKHHKEG